MDSAAESSAYSVLMSVYHRESASNLKTAMESIWAQTVPTDDFVLVCDGPLTAELDAVIEQMKTAHPELTLVRLEKNVGLGNALNIGIRHCRHELVARMDSDDISRPERCEKQLREFARRPALTVCSGIVEEFSRTPEKVEARRTPPENNAEIRAFMRERNPFNHPCVMYRRSAVEAAGGYRHFYLLEDYFLWIRMLEKGMEGYNLQEPLLWMRAGSELYRRRSGWKYAMSQRDLFRYMRDHGLIGEGRYLKCTAERIVSSLLPNGLRETLFKKMMR